MKREPDFSQRNDNLLSLHISVQAAWSIFAAAVIGTSTATWQFWDLKQSIKDGTGDRWRKSEMREYVHDLKSKNHYIDVPDVDDIARKLGQ